jgi:hypothetical protein
MVEQRNYASSPINSEYPDVIVIVGCARSGTTYLLQVLHQLGCSYQAEISFIASLGSKLSQFGDLHDSRNQEALVHEIYTKSSLINHIRTVRKIEITETDILERISEPTFTGIIYAVLKLCADLRPETERLCYKKPIDILHMETVAKHIPSARFIHIVRDGRDQTLSILKRDWGPANLYTGLRFWSRLVTNGRHDGQNLKGRYLEIRYEDLLLHPEDTIPIIVNYIFGQKSSELSSKVVNWVHSTRKLTTVFGWENTMSNREAYMCEAAAGETLRSFDYQTRFDNDAKVSRLVARYYQILDILNRVKNVARRVSSGGRFRRGL